MQVVECELRRRVEHFTRTVRSAGVKLTHQRLEVFREVAASLDHPTAEAVLRGLKPRMPTVSIDTVYRTLWLLSELGIVSTLGHRREGARFDANLASHHHFVCVRCGKVHDFEGGDAAPAQVLESARKIGLVESSHFEVRGVCKACAPWRAAGVEARDDPGAGSRKSDGIMSRSAGARQVSPCHRSRRQS